MRIVIAEDSVLLRRGAIRLLEDADFDVVGECGDAEELLALVRSEHPDVAVVDIRMPPNHLDEGLQAAATIRAELPKVGILMLSQYVEERYVNTLLEHGAAGVGYLLKDRVAEVERFTDAIRQVAAGGSVLDPEVVAHMLGNRGGGTLEQLNDRETRSAGDDGRGQDQPRDLQGALHERARRGAPRHGHLHQARAAGDRRGPPACARGAGLPQDLKQPKGVRPL